MRVRERAIGRSGACVVKARSRTGDLMSEQDRLWAIILAGGDGRRLAPLTDCLYGERLPKQFAVLAGHRSLLQATVDRMLPLVPPSRVVVVVPVLVPPVDALPLTESNKTRASVVGDEVISTIAALAVSRYGCPEVLRCVCLT